MSKGKITIAINLIQKSISFGTYICWQSKKATESKLLQFLAIAAGKHASRSLVTEKVIDNIFSDFPNLILAFDLCESSYSTMLYILDYQTLEKLYRSRQTMLEMLIDRKYDEDFLKEFYLNKTFNEFNKMYKENNIEYIF